MQEQEREREVSRLDSDMPAKTEAHEQMQSHTAKERAIMKLETELETT